MRTKFRNASEAFDYFYIKIKDEGVDFDNTKALFNVGFYIANPLNNKIKSSSRGWSKPYADAEWAWYLSGDPNIKKLGSLYGKIPAIWKKMADRHGNVNSNYGYQWNGFCNDQYQFSMLQDMVARELNIPVGWYYHHAHNLHLYNNKT